MRAFIWTILILTVVESAGRLCILLTGNYPTKTPGMTALELLVGMIFSVWAGYLLGASS
jgi:hypothetical protein